MNRLAADFYPEENGGLEGSVFRYRGASVNDSSGEIIIWYMGSIRDPGLHSGYRVQWVLDVKREYLTGVYVSIVPLE
jgi:hypothetical protein